MTDTDRIEAAISFIEDAVAQLDPKDKELDAPRRKLIAAGDELAEVVRLEQINESVDFLDSVEGVACQS